MTTYDATEAHKFVSPEHLESFRETIAEHETEGRRVGAVIVIRGVPIVYCLTSD